MSTDINAAYLKSGYDKGHSTPFGKQILYCKMQFADKNMKIVVHKFFITISMIINMQHV